MTIGVGGASTQAPLPPMEVGSVIKVFHVRDDGTRLAVLALTLSALSRSEQELVGAAGFSPTSDVLISALPDGPLTLDATSHPARHGRTMRLAHYHIAREFHRLARGATVDVRALVPAEEAAS